MTDKWLRVSASRSLEGPYSLWVGGSIYVSLSMYKEQAITRAVNTPRRYHLLPSPFPSLSPAHMMCFA
jgi:hypothetical protein